MNENTPDKPTAPEPDDNLIAYLDGELPENALRDVEQRLASDPALRRNADAYQRTWELLDELPHVRATEQFTTQTLASIKVKPIPEAESSGSGTRHTVALSSVTSRTGHSLPTQKTVNAGQRSTTARSRNQSSMPIAAWFLGLACSAICGFLVTNRLIPNDSEVMLRELPLLKNWDKYRQVGSLEFLNELANEKERWSQPVHDDHPRDTFNRGPGRESPPQP